LCLAASAGAASPRRAPREAAARCLGARRGARGGLSARRGEPGIPENPSPPQVAVAKKRIPADRLRRFREIYSGLGQPGDDAPYVSESPRQAAAMARLATRKPLFVVSSDGGGALPVRAATPRRARRRQPAPAPTAEDERRAEAKLDRILKAMDIHRSIERGKRTVPLVRRPHSACAAPRPRPPSEGRPTSKAAVRRRARDHARRLVASAPGGGGSLAWDPAWDAAGVY